MKGIGKQCLCKDGQENKCLGYLTENRIDSFEAVKTI